MPNHNFIDLTGQTFNWLYVNHRADNDKDGRAMWQCICLRCGQQCVVSGRNLRSGSTKSCGCYRSDTVSERSFVDLTGQRFGRLCVTGFSHQGKRGARYWTCVCDCQNKIITTARNLIGGYSQSCGCMRRDHTSERSVINVIGKQYGWLRPIERVGSDKYDSALWLCECVHCGGRTVATTHALISGNVQSCGCLNSKGELRIRSFLDAHHIRYQQQKCFIGCINVRSLLFDIYLPDYNLAIEYDGEFHYMHVTGLNNDVAYQQNNDAIKDQYCNENNIVLLRIPYWDKDNIESILTDWLFLNDI